MTFNNLHHWDLEESEYIVMSVSGYYSVNTIIVEVIFQLSYLYVHRWEFSNLLMGRNVQKHLRTFVSYLSHLLRSVALVNRVPDTIKHYPDFIIGEFASAWFASIPLRKLMYWGQQCEMKDNL